jgi:hypothetical protein
MNGQSKRQTKLYLLQICMCQTLIIRLPTFRQMFIPRKCILRNDREMHTVSLHPSKKKSLVSKLEHSIQKERVARKKQSEKRLSQATNTSDLKFVQCSYSLIKSSKSYWNPSTFSIRHTSKTVTQYQRMNLYVEGSLKTLLL